MVLEIRLCDKEGRSQAKSMVLETRLCDEGGRSQAKSMVLEIRLCDKEGRSKAKSMVLEIRLCDNGGISNAPPYSYETSLFYHKLCTFRRFKCGIRAGIFTPLHGPKHSFRNEE